ncbi:metallopeptidase family protein [Brachybacterium hainanense]|uniref:Metallopeptidase family protein n=1 Tax=Brachybacterium hainanense TaxID=1541174 RepID=A0ABV6RBX1_9MICO
MGIPSSPMGRGSALGPARRPRRDRHGRGFRHDLIPPHLPGHLSRRALFDETVLEAIRPHLERFGRRLEHLRVTVEEVPSTDPAPWEDELVPLGRFVAADRFDPPTIVLYRRPIETRAQGAAEIAMMVRQVLAEQIGAMLSLDPGDVDPEAWGS